MFSPEKEGLRSCGFGIPGCGFFSIHTPSDKGKGKQQEVLGLMRIIEGEATLEIIDAEFKCIFRYEHG